MITKDVQMIVVRSLGHGIRSHFQIRLTEWVMLYPAVFMAMALLLQPNMFETSKSYNVIAGWAQEGVWAIVVLLCAVIRLSALVVNGTFENFRFSPHLRLSAAVVSIIFWSQFTLGFLSAALFHGGAWSAPIIYSTVCLLELVNIYRTSADIGATSRTPVEKKFAECRDG